MSGSVQDIVLEKSFWDSEKEVQDKVIAITKELTLDNSFDTVKDRENRSAARKPFWDRIKKNEGNLYGIIHSLNHLLLLSSEINWDDKTGTDRQTFYKIFEKYAKDISKQNNDAIEKLFMLVEEKYYDEFLRHCPEAAKLLLPSTLHRMAEVNAEAARIIFTDENLRQLVSLNFTSFNARALLAQGHQYSLFLYDAALAEKYVLGLKGKNVRDGTKDADLKRLYEELEGLYNDRNKNKEDQTRCEASLINLDEISALKAEIKKFGFDGSISSIAIDQIKTSNNPLSIFNAITSDRYTHLNLTLPNLTTLLDKLLELNDKKSKLEKSKTNLALTDTTRKSFQNKLNILKEAEKQKNKLIDEKLPELQNIGSKIKLEDSDAFAQFFDFTKEKNTKEQCWKNFIDLVGMEKYKTLINKDINQNGKNHVEMFFKLADQFNKNISDQRRKYQQILDYLCSDKRLSGFITWKHLAALDKLVTREGMKKDEWKDYLYKKHNGPNGNFRLIDKLRSGIDTELQKVAPTQEDKKLMLDLLSNKKTRGWVNLARERKNNGINDATNYVEKWFGYSNGDNNVCKVIAQDKNLLKEVTPGFLNTNPNKYLEAAKLVADFDPNGRILESWRIDDFLEVLKRDFIDAQTPQGIFVRYGQDAERKAAFCWYIRNNKQLWNALVNKYAKDGIIFKEINQTKLTALESCFNPIQPNQRRDDRDHGGGDGVVQQVQHPHVGINSEQPIGVVVPVQQTFTPQLTNPNAVPQSVRPQQIVLPKQKLEAARSNLRSIPKEPEKPNYKSMSISTLADEAAKDGPDKGFKAELILKIKDIMLDPQLMDELINIKSDVQNFVKALFAAEESIANSFVVFVVSDLFKKEKYPQISEYLKSACQGMSNRKVKLDVDIIARLLAYMSLDHQDVLFQLTNEKDALDIVNAVSADVIKNNPIYFKKLNVDISAITDEQKQAEVVYLKAFENKKVTDDYKDKLSVDIVRKLIHKEFDLKDEDTLALFTNLLTEGNKSKLEAKDFAGLLRKNNVDLNRKIVEILKDRPDVIAKLVPMPEAKELYPLLFKEHIKWSQENLPKEKIMLLANLGYENEIYSNYALVKILEIRDYYNECTESQMDAMLSNPKEFIQEKKILDAFIGHIQDYWLGQGALKIEKLKNIFLNVEFRNILLKKMSDDQIAKLCEDTKVLETLFADREIKGLVKKRFIDVVQKLFWRKKEVANKIITLEASEISELRITTQKLHDLLSHNDELISNWVFANSEKFQFVFNELLRTIKLTSKEIANKVVATKDVVLSKDQLMQLLKLGDKALTDWFFLRNKEFNFSVDETKELFAINPFFAAKMISEDLISAEDFFSLLVDDSKQEFVTTLLSTNELQLKQFIASIYPLVGLCVESEKLFKMLDAYKPVFKPVVPSRPQSEAAIKVLDSDVAKGFEHLLSKAKQFEQTSKNAQEYYFAAYTHKDVGNNEYNYTLKEKQNARIGLGLMLVDSCLKNKNVNLLVRLLQDKSKIEYDFNQGFMKGGWVKKELDYLGAINERFLNGFCQLSVDDVFFILNNSSFNQNLSNIYFDLIQQHLSDTNTLKSCTINFLTQSNRAVFKKYVTESQRKNILDAVLSNKGVDVFSVLKADLDLLAWVISITPDKAKEIINNALSSKSLPALSIIDFLRSPVMTSAFKPDELLILVIRNPGTEKLFCYQHLIETKKLYDEKIAADKMAKEEAAAQEQEKKLHADADSEVFTQKRMTPKSVLTSDVISTPQKSLVIENSINLSPVNPVISDDSEPMKRGEPMKKGVPTRQPPTKNSDTKVLSQLGGNKPKPPSALDPDNKTIASEIGVSPFVLNNLQKKLNAEHDWKAVRAEIVDAVKSKKGADLKRIEDKFDMTPNKDGVFEADQAFKSLSNALNKAVSQTAKSTTVKPKFSLGVKAQGDFKEDLQNRLTNNSARIILNDNIQSAIDNLNKEIKINLKDQFIISYLGKALKAESNTKYDEIFDNLKKEIIQLSSSQDLGGIMASAMLNRRSDVQDEKVETDDGWSDDDEITIAKSKKQETKDPIDDFIFLLKKEFPFKDPSITSTLSNKVTL